MDWKVFFLRALIALLLGALIGAERQFRQRLTGLRTNALVCTGACLFVVMTQCIQGLDATRVAAYVVSGTGFLGGGVIMRDGMNVRGLNTAATLWCTAAIGVLCSMGLILEAALGCMIILSANILLREVTLRINGQQGLAASEAAQRYHLRLTCLAEEEVQMRNLILEGLKSGRLQLQGLESEDLPQAGKMQVQADILGLPGAAAQVEKLVSRLSREKGVSAIRWQLGEMALA
ncbi:putative Mg2+ transporter-C (MgtC) family protein [Izhakiella capsodis]|uniref:Protein MgtC n=1 Tax=Izhakiella capsodis TaxID=1367852 RepID=A0A1I4VYZ8_9GAMM|nr:MgtC/SapB family protein [Izhakiella capsodis]SFN06472.1 putative Mg2+ transporter-C (MgtC) family protein [Izhakiella capsodis]